MRPRLTFFLLVLVVLPLVLLAWVGRLLWVSESDRLRALWRTTIDQQLQSHEKALEAQVQSIAARCSGLLSSVPSTDAGLRELAAGEPLVRYAFMANEAGQFLVPDAGKAVNASSQDMQFLTRTASVWKSRRPLGQAPVSETRSAPAAPFGWHVWYGTDGPEFLYWQNTKGGFTLGIEVERSAFLSSVLSHLPTHTMPGCIRLVAADGAVLHHEGAYEPADGKVAAMTLACAYPMHHWHWEYVPALNEQATGVTWPFWLGFAGVAALLAGVSVIVFTTYQRHMRQAAQRVSFVNQVSHELKTPLTNIRLYTDLARGASAPDSDRYLNVVEEESSRLSRLIHNVLTFARQERQQLEVSPSAGDMGALLSRVVEGWKPALQRKGIAASLSVETTSPVLFDADATEQILGNLLSNIEKYAVGATQALVRLSESQGFAEIRVTDDGAGIPAKAMRHMFQPFYRARSDLTEGVSGTGLGLSIARGLAEAQGGGLELLPASKGACFVLRLPSRKS